MEEKLGAKKITLGDVHPKVVMKEIQGSKFRLTIVSTWSQNNTSIFFFMAK
jgi:hypothetical protein